MLYIVLQREKAGPEQVIDQEHLRPELPPEEHWPAVVSRARMRTISR